MKSQVEHVGQFRNPLKPPKNSRNPPQHEKRKQRKLANNKSDEIGLDGELTELLSPAICLHVYCHINIALHETISLAANRNEFFFTGVARKISFCLFLPPKPCSIYTPTCGTNVGSPVFDFIWEVKRCIWRL